MCTYHNNLIFHRAHDIFIDMIIMIETEFPIVTLDEPVWVIGEPKPYNAKQRGDIFLGLSQKQPYLANRGNLIESALYSRKIFSSLIAVALWGSILSR